MEIPEGLSVNHREQMIAEHAGLVRMLAYRLGRGHPDPEDLIQWGTVGLIQAVDRFDPSYGVRFSTYAVPYIAGEIRRFLRENRTVKCSRELGRLAGRIRTFQEEYENKNGRTPSVETLCRSLGHSREDILLAICASMPVASLEEPLAGDGEDYCLSDTLAQQEPVSIADHLDLAAGLTSLKEDERRLIHMRYFQGQTQVQTAAVLGLSQVQVCRMEKRILIQLRQKLG